MIRQVSLVRIGAGIALVGAFLTHPATANGEDNQAEEVSLFNGENLEGWVIENNGQFSVRDGLLVVDQGVGWLRSEEMYADFIFQLDFRFLEEKANSGIFIRTGATSKDDENGWPDNGYQVQCMDILTGPTPCATMIPYGAPPFESETDREKLREVYRPRGEWNTYEIRCFGEELTVKLNGETVTTATRIKNSQGHLGIQGEHGRLEFRNLSIKILDGAPDGAND